MVPMHVSDVPRADGELIAGWREGDERAAAELVRRHTPAVSRFVAAMDSSGTQDVEDVVQETFIKAFRRIDSFRGEAKFSTWLMTIASNVVKDKWRKVKKRQVLSIADRELVDHGADPAGEAEAGEMERRLAEGLGGLPRMQRDVFLLRAQQGLDYDEVAVALDTSVAAARVHYHHAVKRLKALLEDGGMVR